MEYQKYFDTPPFLPEIPGHEIIPGSGTVARNLGSCGC